MPVILECGKWKEDSAQICELALGDVQLCRCGIGVAGFWELLSKVTTMASGMLCLNSMGSNKRRFHAHAKSSFRVLRFGADSQKTFATAKTPRVTRARVGYSTEPAVAMAISKSRDVSYDRGCTTIQLQQRDRHLGHRWSP